MHVVNLTAFGNFRGYDVSGGSADRETMSARSGVFWWRHFRVSCYHLLYATNCLLFPRVFSTLWRLNGF